MVTTRLMTAEELLRLPRAGRCRYELARGVLITMAPVGGTHAGIAAWLAHLLISFVRPRHLGQVYVELGFCLACRPDTVRAPDVAFVSTDRLPPPDQRDGFFPGAPALAVEVVSPGDTVGEVLEKIHEYFMAGARLAWVVDPRSRTTSVYRPDGTAQLLREHETLSGEDVLPGFTLPVRDIFV